MLLKIYTDKNSLVVIENIQDIEIHNSTYLATSRQQIVDCGLSIGDYETGKWEPFGPAIWIGFNQADYYGTATPPNTAVNCPNTIPVKYIDYKKNDELKRLAIDFGGVTYLCNDHGKTIERIL